MDVRLIFHFQNIEFPFKIIMSIQEKLLAIDTQDRVRGIIVTVKGTINCI